MSVAQENLVPTRFGLGGCTVVVADNTTQHLATTHRPNATDNDHRNRRLLRNPLVGPRCIEVRHVLAQDTAQMGKVDDQ